MFGIWTNLNFFNWQFPEEQGDIKGHISIAHETPGPKMYPACIMHVMVLRNDCMRVYQSPNVSKLHFRI